MTENLQKKKRIRAGHRGSATRILSRIDVALGNAMPESDQLSQLRLSLSKKLETLKLLDSEIIELTEDDDLVDEIDQADGYKENVYHAITRIDKVLRTTPPAAAVPEPLATAEPLAATTRRTPPPSGWFEPVLTGLTGLKRDPPSQLAYQKAKRSTAANMS